MHLTLRTCQVYGRLSIHVSYHLCYIRLGRGRRAESKSKDSDRMAKLPCLLWALGVEHSSSESHRGMALRDGMADTRTWNQKLLFPGPVLLLTTHSGWTSYLTAVGLNFHIWGLQDMEMQLIIPTAEEDRWFERSHPKGKVFILHWPGGAYLLRGKAASIRLQSLWFP